MSDTGTSDSWQIGKHSFRLDPSHVLSMTMVGELYPEEAAELMRIGNRIAEERPYILAIADVSRLTMISPEARKAMTSVPQSPKHDSMAIFGASFTIRVVVTLTSALRQALGRQHAAVVRMFDTESQARAWLEERRRSLERVSSVPSTRRRR